MNQEFKEQWNNKQSKMEDYYLKWFTYLSFTIIICSSLFLSAWLDNYNILFLDIISAFFYLITIFSLIAFFSIVMIYNYIINPISFDNKKENNFKNKESEQMKLF